MKSSSQRFVSLQDAADTLGVHYMTAYRYMRHGRLVAHKEGGIWKVAAEELQRFQDERSDSKEPPTHLVRKRQIGRAAPWCNRLEACLLVGDAAGAWSVLEAAIDSGREFEEVYLDVLSPAMVTIGERWHAGKLDVYLEHRATVIATRLVARLGAKSAHRGRSRGTVLLGALSGELHSLAISILADVVRLARFEVHDLGADLPSESFLSAVRHYDEILAVGISVNSVESRPIVSNLIKKLRDVINEDVWVFVGGRAIARQSDAHDLGADEWALDARSFVASLDLIVQTRNKVTSNKAIRKQGSTS
ncbi:MAG: helix-turn-helix domain-containing protein [Ilumatobacteraceae bacterium]|nr:helix-turn-helix domain-containing protein [Ilumatobacteraceae bacterium]